MSHAEHDDGAYQSQSARRSRRRAKTAAGAIGLAALLGGGAFLITDQLTDKPETIATDIGALTPMEPASMSASPARSPSRAKTTRTGATASMRGKPAPSASASSKSAAQRIKDARAD